jgi:hypothetical protein
MRVKINRGTPCACMVPLIASIAFAVTNIGTTQAATLVISGAAVPLGAGVVVPGVGTVFGFGAQNNPSGNAWDTTAGSVILNVVPGVSAILTLTGPMLAGGGFGNLDISFDPAGGPGGGLGTLVTILFDSGAFAPIGPPAFDSASLNGTIISALPLAEGVFMRPFTDAGPFGDIGTFAGPGQFNGNSGPVPDPAPPVISLGGQVEFRFANAQAQGDIVRLPGSAVVRTMVPEPSAAMLFGIGFLGIAVWGWQRHRACGSVYREH